MSEHDNARLRVTFVLPYAGMAGGARVAAIYADRLQRRGHFVTVVSAPPRRLSLRRRLEQLARTGRWPSRRPDRSAYFRDTVFTHRILERHRPVTDADIPDGDVVIATWWETAPAVAALSPSKGAKIYFVQHHEVHDPAKAPRVRDTYRLPMHKIVISSWLADVMAGEYADHDVDLILNSVDFEQFDAPPRSKRSVPTAGLLYTPTPFKGVDVSLQAIGLLRARFADLQVVAFGAGPVQDDLPLPSYARYVQNPPQATLRDIYAQCDVWVWGSHVEGFGLPIVEAMACRCPVVSTHVGAAIDLIRDGVSGHVVAPGDSDAMAAALESVLRLPDSDWRRMSDAAYSQARSHSWDDAAAAFEAALRRRIGAATS